jgi:hypothetical protein
VRSEGAPKRRRALFAGLFPQRPKWVKIKSLGTTFRAVIARLDADFSTVGACAFAIRRRGLGRAGIRSAAAVHRPVRGASGGHACDSAETEKA